MVPEGACPDPIDFRAYTVVNIYEHKNAYYTDSQWKKMPRPGKRNYLGELAATTEDENPLWSWRSARADQVASLIFGRQSIRRLGRMVILNQSGTNLRERDRSFCRCLLARALRSRSHS